MNSNLGKRLLFAVGAAPVGWWIINSQLVLFPIHTNLPDPSILTGAVYPGHVLAFLLATIGLYEYVGMLKTIFQVNGFWILFPWLTFQFLGFFLPVLRLEDSFDIFFLLCIVCIEAVIYGTKADRWRRIGLVFCGTFFIWIAGFSLLSFYREPFQALFPASDPRLFLNQPGIVATLLAVFLCDTAAFFIGHWFGRHQLSAISPHKTVEGFVAGLITAVVVSAVGWHFWGNKSFLPVTGVLWGVVVGLSAQAGDLVVSIIKRYFDFKDSSRLIPGHGGVLDRFDSMFFTAPIVIIISYLLAPGTQ